MQVIGNFIDGQIVGPANGQFLDNVDPSTGRPYSKLPDSDIHDIDQAVSAATRAFPEWSATSTDKRSRILLRVADLIEQNLEAIALAECIDNGKPLSRCRTLEIPRAVPNLRFFATAILHERSALHVMYHEALNYTLRRPRGVCGVISPWNLPLYL